MSPAKKTTAKKKTAPAEVVDQEPTVEVEPEPVVESSDPIVLAESSPKFSIGDLAERTGVPAREIRLVLQPSIDADLIVRTGPDEWTWK